MLLQAPVTQVDTKVDYTTTSLTKTTYVTTCPVTTTKTEAGNTITSVYTTVSTIETEVPVTYVVTPTKTATEKEVSVDAIYE